MRWRPKYRDFKPGDRVITRHFLIFPRCLPASDGRSETRWLEFAWIEWETQGGFVPDLGSVAFWVPLRWVEPSELEVAGYSGGEA